MLTKIGVLGDIHTESTYLERTLAYLSEFDLERILATGDIVDGRNDVDRCCQLLKHYDVLSVLGNHDRWFLKDEMRDLNNAIRKSDTLPETFAYISTLPVTKRFQTIAGDLLLCHGIGANDMAKLTPDDYGYAIESNFELTELIDSKKYRFLVTGHTHRRMVRTIDGLTIINAGSLRHDKEPCFSIIDFKKERVDFYDIKEESIILSESVAL